VRGKIFSQVRKGKGRLCGAALPHVLLLIDSLEEIDDAIERCVQVKHGISAQFIYRSLYAAQIYHCMKVCPISSFPLPDSLSSPLFSVSAERAISLSFE
jgi:hypothetical protein